MIFGRESKQQCLFGDLQKLWATAQMECKILAFECLDAARAFMIVLGFIWNSVRAVKPMHAYIIYRRED